MRTLSRSLARPLRRPDTSKSHFDDHSYDLTEPLTIAFIIFSAHLASCMRLLPAAAAYFCFVVSVVVEHATKHDGDEDKEHRQ